MFKIVLLLCLLIASCSALTSCDGHCGESDLTGTCQCNVACENFGDCCSDYMAICYSCNGRCGEAYVNTKPCECNAECPEHGNCCDDFNASCPDLTTPTPISTPAGLNDAAIMAFTEQIFTLDVNSVGTKFTVDLNPPGPLFTSVATDLLDGPTISAFVALRDNYVTDASVTENDDTVEAQEKVAFLDAIVATDVIIATEQFMHDNGLIASSRSLRDVIDEIFFTNYPRTGGPEGSSGFEHSFLGEIDEGSMKGYHNWVSWYIDETENEIDYIQELDFLDIGDDVDGILMMKFEWSPSGIPYTKDISSMWLGSSPELELACYTLCFFYSPDSLCPIRMNGVSYQIQTWTEVYEGANLIGSAYPDI